MTSGRFQGDEAARSFASMVGYSPAVRIPGPLGLCVVDATDPSFFPGRRLPTDWVRAGEDGTWFFLPERELTEPTTYASMFSGFPFCYSPGYPTLDEAATAAAEWQAKHDTRAGFRARNEESFLNDLYGS